MTAALLTLASPTAAELSGMIELAHVGGAVPGVTFYGADFGEGSGRSGWSAGEVNGDGLADLLIGGFRGNPNGDSDSGETYLVYGSASLAGAFDLSHADATFQGIDAGDMSGFSVSSAGDVNGDGLADLLIGAYQADTSGQSNAGETYLIYGQPSVEPADADFDDDGDVDGADLLAWQRGLGATGPAATSAAGNANGDETINANDLAAWHSQLGATPPGDGATTIPEPAAVLLALTAMISFAAYRTRTEPGR